MTNTKNIYDSQRPEFGNPLHWACLGNSVESIDVLLNNPHIKPDVNMREADLLYWSLSVVSVEYGSLGTLKALLNYDVNIYRDYHDEGYGTLLEEALWPTAAPKTAFVNAIMEKDTTSNLLRKRDEYGNTLLISAVCTADFRAFECVMTHYRNAKLPPQEKDQAILLGDDDMATALHWAVSDSSLYFENADRSSISDPLRISEALLDSPYANPSLQRRNCQGYSPFEVAIRRNRIQAVDMILKKHDEHQFDNFYPSQVLAGLNLAVQISAPAVLDLLLDTISHYLLSQPGNDTVMHDAASGKRLGNAEWSSRLESLRLYDIPGSEGNSALHYAAGSGNADGVSALLRQEWVNINSENNSGQTALHLAVDSNMADICAELVEAGADTGVKDHCGLKPSDLAVKKRRLEAAAAIAYHSPTSFHDLDLEADEVEWVQQQSWGYIVLRKSDGSSTPAAVFKYWPSDEKDIVEVALCLQRKLARQMTGRGKSPRRSHSTASLVSRILDLAEYWARSSSARVEINGKGEVRRCEDWGDWEEDFVEPYLTSRVITGRSPRPVRRVVFEITSHEGFLKPSRLARTWFTAKVHQRENSTFTQPQDQGNANREIHVVENHRGKREWFTHKLSWSLADIAAADSKRRSWIAALAPGDRIVVVPHVRSLSCEIWIRRVKVDVFTTCLRSYDEVSRTLQAAFVGIWKTR
ncbi:ankyrin repeat-containing domain protein [Hypoxylon sp. FL1284]|nr:ankyrin repeat-containing domain protein [Hypoxylon sp. FL1284]